jgi:hypothetical protein
LEPVRVPISALARSCKMENIQIIEVQGEEHVIIDRGNGEFTSMPKAVWDEQQAAKEAQSLQGGIN